MSNLDDRFAQFVEKAKQRAAEQIETWFPKEEGDNRAGIVESITFIEFQFSNKHREDGLTPSTVLRESDGTVFRYNWMGTLPETTWERVQPEIGDFVAIHHHGTRPQKDGMNDYELINVVVLDSSTGEEKVLTSRVTQAQAVNYSTGEMINDEFEPFNFPDES